MHKDMVRKVMPLKPRKDLMKILHYAIIQLHVHDLKEAEKPVADIDYTFNKF